MAQNLEGRPSFEQLSGLLANIPQNRLIDLKNRLSCVRRDTRSCKLLQAMILLTLRREAEAGKILDTLREDAAAAQICRSLRGSIKGSSIHPPKQEAQGAHALAQIYSLLAEEKLCSPQARDEAYQVAIEAFCSSNGVQRAKLNTLLAEAWDKCGPGFAAGEASGGFNTPNSGSKKLPRSAPVPIEGSLAPLGQPLRSTGTPTSIVSHFEISQSPTVPYISRISHRGGVPEVSKFCGSAPSSLPQPGDGSFSLVSPSVERSESPGVEEQPQGPSTDDFRGSHLGPSVPSGQEDVSPWEESVQSPVECTEPPNIKPAAGQGPKGGTPPNTGTAGTLLTDPAAKGYVQTPQEDSCSSCPSTGPKATSSSTAVPPGTAPSSSTDSPGDEDQFFMFVVVHANEDESIACRVRERLESMGVPNGATFCEDFLVPGHNQLACFQEALDNSAFTLLLLTENFKNQLCAFQTNMALMNSFTHIVKDSSVIPFIPKESLVKERDMPRVLLGLVALDEHSRVFEKRVKNTFRPSEFQRKKALWSMYQQVRHRERLRKQHYDYLKIQRDLSALSLPSGYLDQVLFPPAQMSFLGRHQVPPDPPPPVFPPTPFMPGMFQPSPGPAQAAPFQPFPVPLPTPMPQGPQPHLIIQHAQMVQIGDYNQMQVERTNTALGVAEDKSQGTEVEARDRHGD